MPFYFSPYEIAVLSMKVEEAGQLFYTKVSNLTKDDAVKKVFIFLAQQETKHRKIFEDIAKETENKYPAAEYVIDIRSQIQLSLDLVTRKAFDFDNVKSDAFDYREAIEVGIQTEIQSISIYQLVKKTLKDAYTPILDQIIAEEEKHLDMLQKLKSNIK